MWVSKLAIKGRWSVFDDRYQRQGAFTSLIRRKALLLHIAASPSAPAIRRGPIGAGPVPGLQPGSPLRWLASGAISGDPAGLGRISGLPTSSPSVERASNLTPWVRTVEHRNGSALPHVLRPKPSAPRPSARRSLMRRRSLPRGTRGKPAAGRCGSTPRSALRSRLASRGSPTRAQRASKSAPWTYARSIGIGTVGVVPSVLAQRAVRAARNADGRTAVSNANVLA